MWALIAMLEYRRKLCRRFITGNNFVADVEEDTEYRSNNTEISVVV